MNLPVPTLLNEDGTLKDNDGIKAAFEAAGVNNDKPIIFTCGGGVMATLA